MSTPSPASEGPIPAAPSALLDATASDESQSRHLVRAMIVGILAGLLAIGFRWALVEAELGRRTLLDVIRSQPHASIWGWSVLPMLAFVVGGFVGWSVLKFAPDAAGSGIPHLKGVLLHLRSLSWKCLLPVKFIGGALSIGAGLSLGREGPSVQMGAAVARAVGDLLKAPARSMPQLLTCGAGAGLAAAFNAPLAGFLFVIEELHRELSARTFAGALVAALSADIVARALAGNLPSFAISGYPPIPLSALPVAILIGILGGILGAAFNIALRKAGRFATSSNRLPRWSHTALACSLCGLVAWWMPDAVGGGHLTAEHLLSGHMQQGLVFLLSLLLVKFALTTVSYASGAPGGIFAPMLLLGAVLGSIVGSQLALAFPALRPHVTALAILGMAAWFTGSVRAPLTGIVLIVEMTGNYHQLLALGVTCLIADQTARLLKCEPIYEGLLHDDLRRRPPRTSEHTRVATPRSLYICVQRASPLEGRAIRSSGLPAGCLIVTVERAGQEIMPERDLLLLAGDHLAVLIPHDQAEKSVEVARLATGL